MSTEKILVTGGTGKTGARVARRLETRGRDVVVGTRNPQGGAGIRFDWHDPSTYASAIEGVGAVYLVAPIGDMEPGPIMQRFIDQAMESGVRRFVLLSSSALPEDGPAMGAVHGYLRRTAPEWAVLQPSWFMQNFSEGPHQGSIRDGGVIVSATGDGAVAFVDAEDIAEVAVRALIDWSPHNRAHLITGGQSLTYAQVAAEISRASGREVRHVNVSVPELADRLGGYGVPPAFAQMLAAMDGEIASGAEDRRSASVMEVTGRAPATFAEFADRSADAWRPVPVS